MTETNYRRQSNVCREKMLPGCECMATEIRDIHDLVR